ncbi:MULTISPECIES: Com family DNA-binding transcriptional regulator [Pasteurellaceae]|nr:Com family DNA-binding transcriptional regulator [Pasteurella atlantica]QVE21711.1 Com family DNA-binding transcriptional regulator [Pasteurella atlantica]
MQKTKEFCCLHCNKLLAMAKHIQLLQIKCSRCKTVNNFN